MIQTEKRDCFSYVQRHKSIIINLILIRLKFSRFLVCLLFCFLLLLFIAFCSCVSVFCACKPQILKHIFCVDAYFPNISIICLGCFLCDTNGFIAGLTLGNRRWCMQYNVFIKHNRRTAPCRRRWTQKLTRTSYILYIQCE